MILIPRRSVGQVPGKGDDHQSETYVEPLQFRNAPISTSPSAKT